LSGNLIGFLWLHVQLRAWQVSGVAFDHYWEAPSVDTGAGEITTYRFGSVGQVFFFETLEHFFCFQVDNRNSECTLSHNCLP
jgi:hypothetical protein